MGALWGGFEDGDAGGYEHPGVLLGFRFSKDAHPRVPLGADLG